MSIKITRLLDQPIVDPSSHPSIGDNIQGPSALRVPDWLPNPLGRYYLYFADHKGSYIRLAFANSILGPWTIHVPGTVRLEGSHFLTNTPEPGAEMRDRARARAQRQSSQSQLSEEALFEEILAEMTTPHIASPDLHCDSRKRQIVMYYHGLDSPDKQLTRVALSNDGLDFSTRPERLGNTYLRAFDYRGTRYAIAMPGVVYRSGDGLGHFEIGPTLFEPNARHMALVQRGDSLGIFWTRVGDAPESILLSWLDLRKPWTEWRASEAEVVMRPELDWEGARAAREPSVRGAVRGRVNQLRDPAVLEDEGRVYLFYSGGGESAIGVAEVEFQ